MSTKGFYLCKLKSVTYTYFVGIPKRVPCSLKRAWEKIS